MGKIREKLLDFKQRLSDRRMYSIVVTIIAVLAAWGVYQAKERANLRQELDNQYNRAFYEMVDYVQNVEVLLMKSLISATPEATAVTMQKAWQQANMAQTNLGQLPISQPILANTSKFLSQIGDLAYSLNGQNMNGTPLEEKQYTLIEQLHGFAVGLEKSLGDLQNSLSTGRLRWGELAKKGAPLFKKTSDEMENNQFAEVDKTFQDYPTLIYDGPFSDHLADVKPKALTGNDISVEEATKKVEALFGIDKIAEIKNTSRNDIEPFKTYSFEVSFRDENNKQKAMLDITQKGGHILWMLNNRAVGQESLDMSAAKKMGIKYLESLGYNSMKDTYYLKEGGVATINYAYSQNDVTVYSDLIKVKIALDNGELVGFESKGYLASHETRNLPAEIISSEEAKKVITPRAEIKSYNLAVIPTDYKTELYVYEFKGKLNEKDFIVYVNAQTGKQEKILIIIDTPNGVLTM